MADKATHGYRVLLVAQRSVTDQTTVQDDRALTLLGYLTFLDLPKPDAADTIAHMHNAGITATLRDTRGQDIDGACGQLAAKTNNA